MTAGNFEAKKWGYRQTQEGVVVSFLIHPNDIHSEIATSPLGTHYMVAFAKIVDGQPETIKVKTEDGPPAKKDRRKFEDLLPTEQAGIRCGDPAFQIFAYNNVKSSYDPGLLTDPIEITAGIVRSFCGVKSRTELNTTLRAGYLWRILEKQYQAWLTDQRYEKSRTR